MLEIVDISSFYQNGNGQVSQCDLKQYCLFPEELLGEERTLNLKLASSFVTTVLQVKWLLLYFYTR